MRGKFRMTCVMSGAAAIINVQRIQLYLEAKVNYYRLSVGSLKGRMKFD